MLGQLARKQQSHSRLDFSRRKSLLLVVPRKPTSLSSNPFKDVVDERVHDGHPPRADASVGVHLLENLVDVGRVRLDTLAFALLVLVTRGCRGLLALGALGSLGALGVLALGSFAGLVSLTSTAAPSTGAAAAALSFLGGIAMSILDWRPFVSHH